LGYKPTKNTKSDTKYPLVLLTSLLSE
jgi:hypothetical protein